MAQEFVFNFTLSGMFTAQILTNDWIPIMYIFLLHHLTEAHESWYAEYL